MLNYWICRLLLYVSTLGHVLPLFTDLQRCFAFVPDPGPTVGSEWYSERNRLASSHPRALGQLDHTRNGFGRVTWLVSYNALFESLNACIFVSRQQYQMMAVPESSTCDQRPRKCYSGWVWQDGTLRTHRR